MSDRQNHLDNLKGKTIVFVSPGYEGKKFVFEKAKDLGVNCIVIDSYASWTNKLVKSGTIKCVVEIDMNQSEDEIFEDCVSRLNSLGIQIDGICTFVELSAQLTSRLCWYFKLPGHNPESVAIARDKHRTRSTISSTLSTAVYEIRNYLIASGSLEDLESAAKAVGFPSVLKPVSGAASLGVQRVNNMEELIETYRIVSDLVSNLIVSNGALERKVKMVGGSDAHDNESTEIDTPTAAAESSTDPPIQFHSNVSSTLANTTIVLEEYIDGQEVDIDIVLWDKEMTFCEISDNGPTVEPYFGETYNSCPTLLPVEAQTELTKMARAIVVDAMKFHSGVFHIEAKYTRAGFPRLIEVNCRMGGGPVRHVHLARSGVDLVTEQILLAAGLPACPIIQSSRPSIGFVDVNARRCGCVGTVDFLNTIVTRPNVVYCKPLIGPDEHIVGPEEGQPSWLAEAVFLCDNPVDAANQARDMYEEIQVLFESHYLS